jgi:hypothetical protein
MVRSHAERGNEYFAVLLGGFDISTVDNIVCGVRITLIVVLVVGCFPLKRQRTGNPVRFRDGPRRCNRV